MGVNGVAAAQTLLDMGSVTPGYCLMYVWQAYKAHGAVSDGKYYPTAYSAWAQGWGHHPGDWNPPAGVPVYFGPKPGSDAGDVVISMGGGRCAATDWPYNGVTNETTLAARQRQINRPYLGWMDNILGYPVDYLGDDDMNSDQDAMLRNIYNAIFFGGPSMPDGGRSLGQSIAELVSGMRPLVTRSDEQGATYTVPWIQELADAKTIGMATEAKVDTLVARPPVTDEQIALLAQAISTELVNAGVGGASPEQVESIVAGALSTLVLRATGASPDA